MLCCEICHFRGDSVCEHYRRGTCAAYARKSKNYETLSETSVDDTSTRQASYPVSSAGCFARRFLLPVAMRWCLGIIVANQKINCRYDSLPEWRFVVLVIDIFT